MEQLTTPRLVLEGEYLLTLKQIGAIKAGVYKTQLKKLVAKQNVLYAKYEKSEKAREAKRLQKIKDKEAEKKAAEELKKQLKLVKTGKAKVFSEHLIKDKNYKNVSINKYSMEFGNAPHKLDRYLPAQLFREVLAPKIKNQMRSIFHIAMVKVDLVAIKTTMEKGMRVKTTKYFTIIVQISSKSELIKEMETEIENMRLKCEVSDVDLFITGYELISVAPPAGGCDGRRHHNKIGDLKIYSPKSKGNNCLLQCMNEATGKTYKNDHTRLQLGLPIGTKISLDDMEKVAKLYEHTISVSDEKGSILGEYNAGHKVVHIMLYYDHYVLLEGKVSTCSKCNRKWIKTHKCNQRELLYKAKMRGERFVIPRKITKEEAFDVKNMFFYDIETFKNGSEYSITPYAYCWWVDGHTYHSYGEGSTEVFIEALLSQKDKIICAYNGAGFDFHFLMGEIIKRGLTIQNSIINGGQILNLKFGNNLKVWDLCRFTLSSLDEACKAYKVSDDNKKTEFDHFKITSWSDVHKYRSEVEPYITRDVLGMKEVFEKVNAEYYELFKCHITDYLTLSSLSYNIWTTMFGSDFLEIPTSEKYDFIRKSLFGGRSYPMVREYTSKHYSEIIEKKDDKDALKEVYKNMDDYIFNADVSSLYPSAMSSYKYPVGKSEWIIEPADISRIGIYEVDIVCPKNLVVPVLPRREKNGVIWDLYDRRGIYTSADLENALRFGYKITKIHKGLVYEGSSDVFSNYIKVCYEMKANNEPGLPNASPVKRQMAKILMNALYGKMLEKARYDETQILNNPIEVWKFHKDYKVSTFSHIADKVVMVGTAINSDKRDDAINKASQLGSFILSYSRRIMLDAMSSIEPTLTSHFFTYTDTDSLHIHSSKLPGLQSQGWLDEGMGKLSDDCKGGRIFREINLAPKLYMYLCLMPDGKIKTTTKAKGISTKYLSPELYMKTEGTEINMTNRLKKVGYGLHLQLAHRKENAFSIMSIDMKRTFNKNTWGGMNFDGEKWFPNGYVDGV